MNTKIIIISATAIIMFAGIWFFGGAWADKRELENEIKEQNSFGSAAGTQLAGTPTAEVDFSGNPLVGGDAVAGQFADDGLFSISVIYSAEYGFSPESFEVQKGDVVTFNIRSAQGDVALDIPDFGISLEKINDQGSDQTVEFTVNESGEFVFSNSLDNAQGTIIVK